MTAAFEFQQGRLPLLISMPHTGEALTPGIRQCLTEKALQLQDTDWHIARLYHFAKEMGSSILAANYSRYVIDLNRPEDDQPLYASATTGLFPDIDFDGLSLYKPGMIPAAEERTRAIEQIWRPYHQKIRDELARMVETFGYALLFDAHSIRSHVPRLFEGKLPDYNLGTNSGESCDPSLAHALAETCEHFEGVSHVVNGRFKGGFITRCFGQPAIHCHAVQLELSQCNYMDEDYPFAFDEEVAGPTRERIQALLDTMLRWAQGHYSQGHHV
ncbi:N-formylglutamate deformylase [Pokkaliibacter sp. CJK22405]|uniref:N-formylglutamate deformylase n=1 Tax=Pokkaliibacter sp. CJK22405 TaxID=3384615 RepID=UPI0039853296